MRRSTKKHNKPPTLPVSTLIFPQPTSISFCSFVKLLKRYGQLIGNHSLSTPIILLSKRQPRPVNFIKLILTGNRKLFGPTFASITSESQTYSIFQLHSLNCPYWVLNLALKVETCSPAHSSPSSSCTLSHNCSLQQFLCKFPTQNLISKIPSSHLL